MVWYRKTKRTLLIWSREGSVPLCGQRALCFSAPGLRDLASPYWDHGMVKREFNPFPPMARGGAADMARYGVYNTYRTTPCRYPTVDPFSCVSMISHSLRR